MSSFFARRNTLLGLIFASSLGVVLAACSGSEQGDDEPRDTIANVAINEGRRAAAIYRTWQQVMSVLLVTLRSPDDWSANNGAVLGCSGGGTVTVTFAPGSPPVGDRVRYDYDACIETVGRIDGAFNAELEDDRRSTQGFWRPSWDAQLTIAGTALRLDGQDTRIDTNDVSGDYTVNARLATTSTLTAPTGESFALGQSATTNRLTFRYDISAQSGAWSDTGLDLDSTGSPDMNLRTQASAAAAVTTGVGALSVGVPESGEMLFRRLVTPEQPDIVVDIQNTGGLADISVRAANGFQADAVQQTWDELLNAANFDSGGLRGE